MSGFVGSLTISQETALGELKTKIQAWIDKEKGKSFAKKNHTTADVETDSATATATAEAPPPAKDSNGDVPDLQTEAVEGHGKPAEGVPPIPKTCTVEEFYAEARRLLANDPKLCRLLRSRDWNVQKA